MWHLLKPLLLVSITYLVGLGFSQDAVASEENFQKLLVQLDRIQAAHNIPAYAIVISSDEKMLLNEVRGVEKAGVTTPVSADAYFRIGSITKTFIGLAALQAEQQVKLNLDKSIEQYLAGKGYQLPQYNKRFPTTRQLLEHTAGLQDMGRKEFDSNLPYSLHQALLKFSPQHKLAWQPGYAYSYSNTGYGYAGRVLEVATKQNISDWLNQSVFAPLKMQTATMELTEQVQQGLVPGYQKDGKEQIPYWHMAYSSLGSINLQPHDMAKLIQLYLGKKYTGISADVISSQEKPKASIAARAGLLYGYSAGLYQWLRDGHLFYGHGGDADGYLSHFGYQKQANRGYFLVINTFNGRAKNQMRRIVEEFLVKELPRPEVKFESAKKPFNNRDYQHLVGEYQRVTRRFGPIVTRQPLTIKWQHRKLQIKEPGSDWDELVQVDENLFKRRYETRATVVIIKVENDIWLQGDEGNWVKTQ